MAPANSACLLMTSQVIINSPNGKQVVAQALLDSGATISLISKWIVQELQLEKSSCNITLACVQGVNLGSTNFITNFNVLAILSGSSSIPFSAIVVNKVACNLLLQVAVKVRRLPHLKDLELADPTFHQSGKIDLLIGGDAWADIIIQESRIGKAQEPIAQRTIFGWAIVGKNVPHSFSTESQQLVHFMTSINADSILQRFWDTEDVISSSQVLTPEESKVVSHFANHYLLSVICTQSTERYQVTLPRKTESSVLGESRKQALQHFQTNERSIIKMGTWKAFQEVIQEYLDLGHAEPVTSDSVTNLPTNTIIILCME